LGTVPIINLSGYSPVPKTFVPSNLATTASITTALGCDSSTEAEISGVVGSALKVPCTY